jgi:hypothetical protein
MDDLQINPKFKQLLPPLSPNEYEVLEASILEKGVEEKIQAWKNQIIDGHNRYEIATRHGLPVMIRDRTFDFQTEDEVLQWIFENQLGRRNLTDNVRTEVIGRYYELIKKPVGNPQLVRTDLIGEPPINIEESEEPDAEYFEDEIIEESPYEADEYSQVPQPREPQTSRKKAAHTYGVSESKIKRASTYVKALDQVPEEVQEQARAGKVSQAEVIRQASGEEKIIKKVFDKKEMKRLISKIAFEIESIAAKCPDSREECDVALNLCREAQNYTGV